MVTMKNRLWEQAAGNKPARIITTMGRGVPAPRQGVDQQELQRFAQGLGVSSKSLRMLGVGRGAYSLWAFPERDSFGRTIGITHRLDRGDSLVMRGSKRGLTMPWPIDAHDGTSLDNPILLVEGATDTAVGLDLGFVTIGGYRDRDCGLKFLVPLLSGRDVVVVGENGGTGRQGAEKIALGLCGIAKSVRIVYPLKGAKDLRDWHSAPAGCTRLEVDSAIAAAHMLTPLLLLTSSFVTLERGLAI